MSKRSLTVNGITIYEQPANADSFILWVNASQSLSNVVLRDSVENKQGFNGVYTGNQFYGERIINVAAEVYAKTYEDMEDIVSQIKLSLKIGTYAAIIRDDIEKQAVVRISQLPAFTQLETVGLEKQLLEFTLRADDPFFYTTEEFTFNVNETFMEGSLEIQDGDLPELPFQLGTQLSSYATLNNTTGLPVQPKYIITGAMTNPAIRRRNSDDVIELTVTLGALDTLVIDTLSGTLLLNGIDVSGQLTTQSTLFSLPVGTSEIGLFDNDDTPMSGSMTVYYRKAYV